MDFTSYEDFKIKKFLDEDRIIIMQKPRLAVEHANNTLQRHPDSPRAKLNLLYALLIDQRSAEVHLPFDSYFTLSENLFMQLVEADSETIMVAVLNAVCEMWKNLVTAGNKPSSILQATNSCLAKPGFLRYELLMALRGLQATSYFLLQDFESSFQSLSSFFDLLKASKQQTGQQQEAEPFLKVFKLALTRVRTNEIQELESERLKEELDLWATTHHPEFQKQIMKYEDLMTKAKENQIEAEVIKIFRRAAEDVGMELKSEA